MEPGWFANKDVVFSGQYCLLCPVSPLPPKLINLCTFAEAEAYGVVGLEFVLVEVDVVPVCDGGLVLVEVVEYLVHSVGFGV